MSWQCRAGAVEIYKVTSGSWGSPLASASTGSWNLTGTQCIQVTVKGRHVEAVMHDMYADPPGWVARAVYDSATEIDTGRSGLYSNYADVRFDFSRRRAGHRAAAPRPSGRGSTVSSMR